MKTPLLTLAAAVLLAAPLAAQPEALSVSAAAQFRAVSLAAAPLRFVSVSPAAAALRAAGLSVLNVQSVTVLDIERLYDAGSKVTKADVAGWFSGRRFSSKGVTAQLLAGADVLRDADAGSLGGSDFKLASVGGAEPVEGSPADLFDTLGSELANNIAWVIHEEGSKWRTVTFADTGARGADTRGAFEVRKNGDVLVAKYSDGTYAYFFKRVR